MLMVVAGDVLIKGANVSLLHRSAVEQGRLYAVVRWSDPRGVADVDVSALLLGADGRVRSDEDFVFYNAPAGGDGAAARRGLGPARRLGRCPRCHGHRPGAVRHDLTSR
jgi:TerD domain